MPAAITILYPNVDDATFDLDYDVAEHMPLVQRLLAPHGMTGWRVARLVDTPTGAKSPNSIVATLDVTTVAGFKAGLAANAADILGDVPKFSNKDPLIMIGEVVGQS